jgi:hypothetical protein
MFAGDRWSPSPDLFDAELFGVTPREAEVRDPQFRHDARDGARDPRTRRLRPAALPARDRLFASANTNRTDYDYIEQNPQFVDAVSGSTRSTSRTTPTT